MLTRDLHQSQTNKEKTDLLICGTLGVHLIQNTKEDKIGPDYKDNGCNEKKPTCYEADGVHVLFIIYAMGPINGAVSMGRRNTPAKPEPGLLTGPKISPWRCRGLAGFARSYKTTCL